MSCERNNSKTEYSLNALAAALFDLMKEKHIDDITITELCNRAQVARKTFYRNCITRLDLVEYQIEKTVEELLETVDYSSRNYKLLYCNFFEFWKKQEDFLTILLRQGLFDHFCSLFTQCCQNYEDYEFLSAFLEEKENQNSLRKYHHAFLVGGLCQILEQWTREGFKTSVSELVSVLSYLVPQY